MQALPPPLASQMEIKKQKTNKQTKKPDSGLWRLYSLELLGWMGEFSINKDNKPIEQDP